MGLNYIEPNAITHLSSRTFSPLLFEMNLHFYILLRRQDTIAVKPRLDELGCLLATSFSRYKHLNIPEYSKTLTPVLYTQELNCCKISQRPKYNLRCSLRHFHY